MTIRIVPNQTILTLNEGGLDGLVYTEEALTAAISKISGKIFGTVGMNVDSGNPFAINLERVAGEVENIRIEDGKCVGDFKIFNTPYGKMINQMISDNLQLHLAPRGMAKVNYETREITDFTFISIGVTAGQPNEEYYVQTI